MRAPTPTTPGTTCQRGRSSLTEGSRRSGEGARAAATGQLAIETSDFYFRNVNPRLRTLAVAPGARITSGLYKGGPKTVKLDQLEAQRPATDAATWPFKLTLVGGKVTRMDEIFQS
ncbi:MAG TPA: hypothetical protein VKG45_05440 [Actinomycetes bacterium]|nr:hypothetical protein [Actinomycetes bacterium]